ncbi:WD40 repeat domain-containing protein [Nonomuraea sp. NPDC000554]|uniref:WD40 repeat domain-containing protein n=1 Tax=Nonomuraea sp. NPDC000554 TaxID=3154259 RepID=UPI00332C6BB8
MKAEWIDRPAELEQLVSALVSGESGLVALVPEVDGAEGFGTTALAAAACADPRVRRRFPKGVAWLTVDADPPEILRGHLMERIEAVGDELDPLEVVSDPEGMVACSTRPGDGLVVLDGLRHPALVYATAMLAPHSSVLATARTAAGLPEHATIVEVPPLERGWPLLVALADALHTAAPRDVDLADAGARTAAVHRVLAEGLPRLGLPDSVERLVELGVFAGDGTIPAGLVRLLWHETAGLSSVDTELTLAGLSALGLLSLAPDRQVVVLPDAVRAYARGAVGSEVTAALVRALDDGSGTLESAEERSYVLARLPDHYTSAGGDVADLVCDGGWIASKLEVYGVTEVERDLTRAGTPLAERLRHTLAQNTHLLERSQDGTRRLAVLAARLHAVPMIAHEVRALLRGLGCAWLECLWEPPDLAHPALRRTLSSESGAATAVAFGPDGGWVAAGDESGTATIWNADGTVRATLEGHDGQINAVAVAACGSWLATGGDDGTVRLWRPDGTEEAVLRGHDGPVSRVAIAPDGTWLASAGPYEDLRAWRGDGTPLWHARAGLDPGGTLSISSDSTGLVLTGGGGARFWTQDGTPQGTVEAAPEVCTGDPGVPLDSGHRGTVLDVALSPDGTWLASAGEDGTVRIWDRVRHVPPPDEHMRRRRLSAVRVAGQGGWLATAGPGGPALWDDEGSALGTIGEAGGCTAVAISPDESWLAATTGDGELWLAGRDGTVRARVSAPPWSRDDVVISPDGSWLATAGDEVRVWRPDGTPLRDLRTKEMIRSLAVAPDGSWLAASGDEHVQVWHADGWHIRALLRLEDVTTLAASPDGAWLAAATREGDIHLCDPDGAPLTTLVGPLSHLTGLAAGPFGWWLASTSTDGELLVWDVGAEAVLAGLTLDDTLNGCAWTPGGTRVYVAGDAGLYGFKLNQPR